jgi:hypothetical protein
MLYAGCSNCQRIVPLHCAGLMFPHMPLEAVPMFGRVGCPLCGVAPPVFTCMFCYTTQFLFVQGAAPAMAAPGMPQMQMQMQMPMPQLANALQTQGMQVAPVVQAPAGSGEGVVKGLIKDVAKSFTSSFGEGLAKQLLGAFFGGGR